MSERVQGFCPMGCGETLFLGADGHVTCSLIGCSDPTAVDTILGDAEHEHVVELDAAVFTVRHPLRERVDDQLMRCELHVWLNDLPGPPGMPGRYRVRASGVDAAPWTFEALELWR